MPSISLHYFTLRYSSSEQLSLCYTLRYTLIGLLSVSHLQKAIFRTGGNLFVPCYISVASSGLSNMMFFEWMKQRNEWMKSPIVNVRKKEALWTWTNGRRDGTSCRKDSGYVSDLHLSHRAEVQGLPDWRDSNDKRLVNNSSVARMEPSPQTWGVQEKTLYFTVT